MGAYDAVTVRLVDRAGALVATATLPQFNPLPEVVTWGSRGFIREGDGPQYREGMVYPLAAVLLEGVR